MKTKNLCHSVKEIHLLHYYIFKLCVVLVNKCKASYSVTDEVRKELAVNVICSSYICKTTWHEISSVAMWTLDLIQSLLCLCLIVQKSTLDIRHCHCRNLGPCFQGLDKESAQLFH